jgi:hypothetical protein
MALVLPLALLLPRFTWDRYALWLLPGYAAGLAWLAVRPYTNVSLRLGALLGTSYALTALAPFNAPGFYNNEAFRAGPLSPLTSLPMFGTLLLWCGLGLMIREEAARDQAVDTGPVA